MGPISLFEYESLARERMPRDLYDYIEGGAVDEITLARNRRALDETLLSHESSSTLRTVTSPPRYWDIVWSFR